MYQVVNVAKWYCYIVNGGAFQYQMLYFPWPGSRKSMPFRFRTAITSGSPGYLIPPGQVPSLSTPPIDLGVKQTGYRGICIVYSFINDIFQWRDCWQWEKIVLLIHVHFCLHAPKSVDKNWNYWYSIRLRYRFCSKRGHSVFWKSIVFMFKFLHQNFVSLMLCHIRIYFSHICDRSTGDWRRFYLF